MRGRPVWLGRVAHNHRHARVQIPLALIVFKENAMTREEHLKWCKDRALEYVNRGELQEAFNSMASDLMKHPETAHHKSTIQFGMQLLLSGSINTEGSMRKWIEGFN